MTMTQAQIVIEPPLEAGICQRIMTALGFDQEDLDPAIGINENPVTGNGNGPLGAYLVHHGLVSHDNRPVQTRVGGQAVMVFKTAILI